MERRRRAVAAALALAALAAAALAAVPVAAHTNHAGADPQVSANGTVVVESVFIASDGWVVLHRDDGGSPGAVIGHARARHGGGLKEDVPVRVDRSAWEGWSNRTVWVALHADEGGGGFDPEEDPLIRSFDSPAGERFTLARGEPAVVTAAGFAPQRSRGNVTVRRATLPTAGHVVVHNGSVDGAVLGSAAVGPGTHRNVSVGLPDGFHRRHDEATLAAALYADDGDGRFDDGDRLVRAGEAAVAATFAAEFPATATATSTGSQDSATSGGDAGGTDTGAGTGTPTDGGGPGFGVAGALAALVAIGIGLASRGRD